MNDLLVFFAPLIIGINGILLIVNEVISIRKEKEGKTEYEEIKERWERAS